MQIIIVQAEIEEAIRNHIQNLISIKDGMKIEIDLRATRGDAGFVANIDILPEGGKRATAPATRAAAPVPTPAPAAKPAPVAATVTAVAEPEVQSPPPPPEGVEETAVGEPSPAPVEETVAAAPAPSPAKSLFANLKKPVNS